MQNRQREENNQNAPIIAISDHRSSIIDLLIRFNSPRRVTLQHASRNI